MDVQAAIDLLIDSSEEATQMIDQQIAELEAKLARLKRARQVLAKACTEHRAPKRTALPRSEPAADGKLDYWDKLEQQIYDAVNNCAVKLTCKELGEMLNLNYTSIGRCITKSQRLAKEGSYIVVIA